MCIYAFNQAYGKSSLLVAVQKGYVDTVNALLSVMDVNNEVDAETACAVAGSGNIKLMQAFRDAQCFQPFYTSRDVNGFSPFLIACQSDRNLEIVKLVVEKTNKPTLCNLIQ